MDPETVCGLPSTSKKARLLIGRARWYWNSIGPILATAAKGTSMVSALSQKKKVERERELDNILF